MNSPNRSKISRALGALVLALAVGAAGEQAALVAATPRYSVREMTTAEKIPLVVLRDETGRVEAAVAPTQGGELCGVTVEFQGKWVELLHRGRDYRPAPGFRGKAFILWPAVGASVPPTLTPAAGKTESSYDYLGKRYAMPQHGFARQKAWQVVRAWANATEAAVEVVLKDDADTRALYPFGFAFHITYRVTEGRVELQHEVKAAADNAAPMFFSIGNHIAFAVPLLAGSAADAFTIESPARLEYLRGSNGAPDGTTRERGFPAATRLAKQQFVPAMAVGGYAGDPWFRVTDAGGLGVKVSHRAQAMPAVASVEFNLWGSVADGYFCPEPIVGVHNALNTRRGDIEVAPGKSWTWTIRVEPERVAAK